ncbi:MAG: hypothetical protein AAB425_09355 [Bdellovibrionota bacterium]
MRTWFGLAMPFLALWLVAEMSPGLASGNNTPPVPSVSPSPKAKTAAEIISHLMKLEDPFRKPVLAQGPIYRQSPLETFGVDTFKLLAVVTGPYEPYAMVAGSNGETYFLKAQTKIGVRKGYVSGIYPDRVVVNEQITNLLGQVEMLESEIRMPVDKNTKLGDAKIAGIRLEPELLPSPVPAQ